MHVLNLLQRGSYPSRPFAIERKFSQDKKVAVAGVVNWQQSLKVLKGGYGFVRCAFSYCRAWINASFAGLIIQLNPANIRQVNVNIVTWRWVDLRDLNVVCVRIRLDTSNLRMEVA